MVIPSVRRRSSAGLRRSTWSTRPLSARCTCSRSAVRGRGAGTTPGDVRHPRGIVAALLVEVTHPVHDVNTPQVGVQAFREGRAAALLVAGTHRYANRDGSSDVAHVDERCSPR